MFILIGIISLMQYIIERKTKSNRPKQCPHCGKANPRHHGVYYRKANREPGMPDLIPIDRYFCTGCKRTCSVLPECLPPRRWYLWDIQQTALTLFLSGLSQRAIAKLIQPSRQTITRWMARFKEQFLKHESVLRNHQTELGRTSGFIDFWKACFNHFSLAKSMRLCHVDGVFIP
jgi:transposase-like protein